MGSESLFLRRPFAPPCPPPSLVVPLSLVERWRRRLQTRSSKRFEDKMNHRAMQQQNALSASEEMRAPFAVADRKTPVFCPKPRRLSPLAAVAEPVLPFRWLSSHQTDFSDSKPGADLHGIFLAKGGEQNQVSSSPPFFCGSPPTRAANPVVHDARFGDDRPPAAFAPVPLIHSGPPLSPKQGCAHAKFGLKPAAVRIEGFDCLNRDRRSCSSITAVA